MRYLVTINIPYALDAAGRVFTEPLWIRDIECHAKHVDELIIAAPQVEQKSPHWEVIDSAGPVPCGRNISFVPVPAHSGFFSAWLDRSRIRSALRNAIAKADVVQTNVGGWPLPIGWLAGPMARALGKPTVSVVESAPWRGAKGKARIFSLIFERCACREVQSSDVAFFTHAGYERTMLRQGSRRSPRTCVVPASWIDPALLLPVTAIRAGNAAKQPGALKILFAGRLVEQKGLRLLLEVVERFAEFPDVRFGVIGEGPMGEQVDAMAARFPARFKRLAPVPYGPNFFEIIDAYDLVLVPTLSDEQPRIIFDAFARGVPVVASDTEGNRQCVQHLTNGWIFKASSHEELVAKLTDAASLGGDEWCRFRRAALESASSWTHDAMHATRRRVIDETCVLRAT